jgi:hypothetical protein
MSGRSARSAPLDPAIESLLALHLNRNTTGRIVDAMHSLLDREALR